MCCPFLNGTGSNSPLLLRSLCPFLGGSRDSGRGVSYWPITSHFFTPKGIRWVPFLLEFGRLFLDISVLFLCISISAIVLLAPMNTSSPTAPTLCHSSGYRSNFQERVGVPRLRYPARAGNGLFTPPRFFWTSLPVHIGSDPHSVRHSSLSRLPIFRVQVPPLFCPLCVTDLFCVSF